MGTTVLQEGSFADFQESRVQFANIFKYVYCRPARGSISYFTEIRFAKRNEMCSAKLQVRFSDDQDLLFQ